MNKRLRKKLQTKTEVVREITYQEAWNKISEFMNSYHEFTFMISPWPQNHMKNKYTLRTIENSKYIDHFIANEGWNK